MKEFKSKDGRLDAVIAEDLKTGERLEFHPQSVFLFIGLTPNSEFLKGSVDLDKWGFVKTDDSMMTSLPGVFAAGDLRAGSTKQLASATGEGASALLMVRQYLQKVGDVAEHAQAS